MPKILQIKAVAEQRAQLHNAAIAFARANPGKLPPNMKRLRRLNIESATRRSLVGDKGMRA
ncbi:hypothetical protein [Methylobacterium haplocladii]|nr:hypothetical protein [Methylobacterium haplocladii]GJD85449.1 hypothetical protein HPGCJGGD_3338 [Methylobacterium haplocladii]